MSAERDECLEYLDDHNDDAAAAARDIVDNGTYEVRLYITIVGLMRLQAEQRRKNRRLLALRVRPQFIANPGAPPARIPPLSRGNERRLRQQAREFFADWKIGTMSMAEMTKENLLEEAAKERRKSDVHLFDALLYEEMAAPMQPGQLVPDFWVSPEAVRLLRDELWRRRDETTEVAETRPTA